MIPNWGCRRAKVRKRRGLSLACIPEENHVFGDNSSSYKHKNSMMTYKHIKIRWHNGKKMLRTKIKKLGTTFA